MGHGHGHSHRATTGIDDEIRVGRTARTVLLAGLVVLSVPAAAGALLGLVLRSRRWCAAAILAAGAGAVALTLPELEDELCDFGPDGLSNGRSPDRLDALVWAVTALMLEGGGEPRVRGV